MEGKDQKKRIAIFCQGGGSHTAFTAGALKKLLTRGQARYDFVAFSGTSGGAICALLAWYGSLTGSPEKAVDLLDVFWKRDKSANTSPERIFNDWLVNSLRWHQETGFLILQSPNFYSELAQDQLRRAIERKVGFDEIDKRLMKPESPMLFIGAVDVLTGSITTFRSHRRVETDEGPRFVFNQDPDTGITAQAVLASAAIPPIFGAVRIGRGVYWDGMFSQNPPVRDLPDASPDEIWIVQINPSRLVPEPEEPGLGTSRRR